jgi:ubiquitin carboxyl-terminal hydrolase 8
VISRRSTLNPMPSFVWSRLFLCEKGQVSCHTTHTHTYHSHSITGEAIEDSLHVAPRVERTLFTNRDKFDVVVIYDESTSTYESTSSVWFLFKAIYEFAFKKILKHSPMLLVGGLQAWKEQFGDAEVMRGVSPGASVDKEFSTIPRVTAPVYTRSTSGAGSNIPINGSDSSYLNEDRPRPSVDSITGPSRYYLKREMSFAY